MSTGTPFQIVRAIGNEPLEMGRRLDLADWLARNGEAARAQWIRQCCAVWDAVLPLPLGMGTAAGPIVSAPWGIVDLSNTAVYRWQEIRPDYWTELTGVTQTAYFGRIVLTASDDAGVESLGQAEWLPQAWRDGWLEAIDLRSVVGSQLQLLATWPAEQRELPLAVDTTYFSSAEIDNELMRDTLSLPGLQGIVLSETEIRYACVKRFAELAADLRYLRLHLKAAGTSLRMLEQTAQLKKLRSLLVSGSQPDDSSLDLLTRVPHVQTLRLAGLKKISDAGLLQVASMPSLRMLSLDLPQVSRAGVEELRAQRADLTVQVAGDMRGRLGPA